MATIINSNIEWTQLAQRIQSVAKVVKSLPTDHPRYVQEMEALEKELKAIAARLRGR